MKLSLFLLFLLPPLMVLASPYKCPKCNSQSIVPYGGEHTGAYSYHDHTCRSCGHRFHVGDSTLAAEGDSIYVEGDQIHQQGPPEPPSASCGGDSVQSSGSGVSGVSRSRLRRTCASDSKPAPAEPLCQGLGGEPAEERLPQGLISDLLQSIVGGVSSGVHSGGTGLLRGGSVAGAPSVLRIRFKYRPGCLAGMLSDLNLTPEEACTETQQTGLEQLAEFQGIVMSLLPEGSAEEMDQDEDFFQAALMSHGVNPVTAGEVPALARSGQLFAEVIQVPGGTSTGQRYVINLLMVEGGQVLYYRSDLGCWLTRDFENLHFIIQKSQTMEDKRPTLYYKIPREKGDED